MVQAVRRGGDGGDRERMDRMRVRLRTTTVGRLLILCGLIAELVAAPFALAGPRVAVAARAAAVQPSTPLTSGPVPVTATTTMTATTAAPTATATLSTGAPAALGSMSSTPGASVTATGLPAITGTAPATATTTIAAPTAPTLTASLSTTTTATAVLTAGAALTSTVSPTATATVSDTAPATASVPSTDTIASPARPAGAPVARLLSAALPLSFEENRGQTDPAVKYLAHGPGYTLFLTADETVLTLSHPRTPGQRRHAAHGPDQATTEAVTGTAGTTLRLRYAGANAHPQVDATDQLPGLINYFIGSNPADWQTDVPTFSHVTYHDVYPGTDLVYYGTAGRLEYDWRLQPGADPGAIGFSVEGARGLRLDGAGALSIDTPGGALRQHAPVAYQEIDGRKRPVASRYVLSGDRIGFALGDYDKSKPVVIDPVLSYSSYLGGGYTDEGYGIAVDGAGSAYITGQTNSTYFPTKGSIQGPNGGSPNPHSLTYDAFVTKLNPAGNALVYSTYLGGQNNDYGRGIAVGGQGAAYVTGYTNSTNFPVRNATQSSVSGSAYDAFVVKVNAAGSLLPYATYLGGSGGDDIGTGIAVDAQGSAYVTGYTAATDFPTTNNALQGGYGGGDDDAFVAEIGTPSGTVPWHPHSTGGGLGAVGGGVDLSVDLADGHADIGLSGIQLPGRGPDLTVNRTWDSSLAGAGANPLASSLTPRMGGVLTATVSYTDGSGSVWPFLYTGSPTAAPPYSAYRTPLGQPWQLTASPSGYTLTNVLTGAVWTFDGQGRLLSETDAYGNTNSYSYGAGSATSPSNESNSGGRGLALAYTNGQLSDAQSPLWASSGGAQGQHVTYGYNGSGQIVSMTRGAGAPGAVTTTLGYSGTLLTGITTPSGRAWQLGYDAAGRVATVTSPASGTAGQPGYTPAYTTQYTYSLGQTTVVQGAGTGAALTTTYTLDAAGETTSVTDGLGHTSHSAYDANHDVLMSSDANNNTTTNKYQYIGPNGAVGQIIEEDQPAIQPYVPGNGATVTPVITHTYDATTHDLVATKLPEGGLTTYTYDGHHAVVGTAAQTTCPGCGVSWQGTINQYDPYGERTSTTDGRGVNATNGVPALNGQASAYTSHQSYDAQGDLTSSSTPPITATLNGVTQTASAVTTSYTYDGDGNRQTLVSANGNTTSYGYDHLGRQTALTLPTITLYNNTTTAPVQTTSYDADGNVARETDGKGDTTLSSYDPEGRLVAQTNPVSGTTFSVYNATELASQRDPQGNVTAYSYDAAGRAIGQADPMTGTVQYGYDAVGNTTAMTLGDSSGGVAQVETMGYDAQDRVTTDTVTAPATGTVTTLTAYDQDGNVAQTVQPRGDVTYNVYDAADRLTTVEIDAALLTKAGAATHARYESYAYDAAGNVAQSTDADNLTTTNQYDGDNRVVRSVDTATDSSGTTTITTSSGYDPNGNTVSRTTTTQKPDGTSETHTATSAYNAADQPTGTSDDGLATSYGYDAADQIRTETTSDGTTNVTNGLDAAGRITSVAEGAGGAGPYSSQFGYNADSLPSTIALPGGVSEHASYDANSNLTGLTVAGPSMGTITNTLSTTYGYAYNGQGLATSETTISGTDTVTHDPATGRVTADCGPQVIATTTDHCYHWSYDANGNVTSGTADNGVAVASTFSASAPNELQKIMGPAGSSPTSYAYDNNGDTTEISNTIAVTAPTSKDALDTRLTYDAQARPVTISKGGAQPLSIALGYDAQGRRARYTVTVSGTVTVDERFGYRGGALGSVSVVTATLNGDGSVKARGGYNDTYITGPQGEPLEFVRVAGGATNRYFYVLDGHGSVVAVTDTSGKVVDRYNYDVWGEPIGTDYQTVQQQVRYAGYWWDGEVQWYWLAGRHYDPEAQRFLQPDPTDLDGVRTYVYANDDPIDLIEVGGAFSVSGFFHHAVEFLDSAAHVTFKVAEAAWNAVAGDDVHVICCTLYPLPIKALAVLDLAITVIPGADAAKLLEVGVKGAAKAGGEQAAFALVRWIAGKTDGKVAADLSDNVLRDAFAFNYIDGCYTIGDDAI